MMNAPEETTMLTSNRSSKRQPQLKDDEDDPNNERQVFFKVKFVITKEQNAQQTINMAVKHRSFISKFIECAPGASFAASRDDVTPTPMPFSSITNFPNDSTLHKQFFRSIVNNNKDGSISVIIHHKVVMNQTLNTVKHKMFSFLKLNKIFINSTCLDRVETTPIAWYLGAHPAMVYRPNLQNRTNELLQDIQLTDEE